MKLMCIKKYHFKILNTITITKMTIIIYKTKLQK